jgi:hypothetical protein
VKYDTYDGDGKCRFVLGQSGAYPLLVFGVNPSTADQEIADQTITKTERFAQGWGFDGFVMLNIFPWRSTFPSLLPLSAEDRLKNQNLKAIHNCLSSLSKPTIWAAWGNTIDERSYLPEWLRAMVDETERYDILWRKCGSLTKSGNPRHPSRLSYREKLTDFDVVAYLRSKRN